MFGPQTHINIDIAGCKRKVRRRGEILKIWLHVAGWKTIKINNRMWLMGSLSYFRETRVERIWREAVEKKKNKTKSHNNLKWRASNLVILSVSVLCKMNLPYSPLKSFQWIAVGNKKNKKKMPIIKFLSSIYNAQLCSVRNNTVLFCDFLCVYTILHV